MTGLLFIAVFSVSATRVLIPQVMHHRYANNGPTGETWEMALFATGWSTAAAIASAALRLLLEHLLPAPLAAGFDSTTAGAAAGLIGAISCASVSWTALIVHKTIYDKDMREIPTEKLLHAAATAAMPTPPETKNATEARRARDTIVHTLRILGEAVLLGGATGAMLTLAVGETTNDFQQLLAAAATHGAVITGGVSGARWLQLGLEPANKNDDGGTPQAPAPTG